MEGVFYLSKCKHLSLSSMDCFPYLIAHVFTEAVNKLKLNDSVSEIMNDMLFLYILSGTGEGQFTNNYLNKSYDVILKKNSLVTFIDGEYSIKATDNSFKYLALSFIILTEEAENCNNDNFMEDCDEKNHKFSHVSIEIPLIQQIESYSYSGFLLKKIADEVETHKYGYRMAVQCVVPELVIQLTRDALGSNERVLSTVSAIDLYSVIDFNKPLKKGRKIWISDAEIWIGNPEGGDSKIIDTMHTDNYYIGSAFQKNRDFEYQIDKACKYHGKNTGMIEAFENTEYQILLMQNQQAHPLDLRQYRNSTYIKFAIKSNMPGTIGVTVYSNEAGMHNTSGHVIEITHTDEWEEHILPLLPIVARNKTSNHVVEAIAYIEKYFSQPIKVSDIAENLHLNVNYLSTIFKKQMDISISQYLINYRILEAKTMLMETNRSIEDIVLSTGFYDYQHFCKVFKNKVGYRPSLFRKMNKNIN